MSIEHRKAVDIVAVGLTVVRQWFAFSLFCRCVVVSFLISIACYWGRRFLFRSHRQQALRRHHHQMASACCCSCCCLLLNLETRGNHFPKVVVDSGRCWFRCWRFRLFLTYNHRKRHPGVSCSDCRREFHEQMCVRDARLNHCTQNCRQQKKRTNPENGFRTDFERAGYITNWTNNDCWVRIAPLGRSGAGPIFTAVAQWTEPSSLRPWPLSGSSSATIPFGRITWRAGRRGSRKSSGVLQVRSSHFTRRFLKTSDGSWARIGTRYFEFETFWTICLLRTYRCWSSTV